MKIDEHVRASIEATLNGIVEDAVHFRDFLEALNQVAYEASAAGNAVPPYLRRVEDTWYLRISGQNVSDPLSLEQAARAYVEALIQFGRDQAED